MLARLSLSLIALGALTLVGAAAELTSQADGQAKSSTSYALRVARVLTMGEEDAIVERGLILVSDGAIQSVEAAGAVPDQHVVLDFPGAWAAPGMIDLHSHVHTGGWGDLNDMVLPTNPGLSSRPTLVPSNPDVRRACAGGVTTMFGIPGSGTAISGFGVLYKAKTAATYEEVVVSAPGGMKVAQTHNPERRAGDLGATRAGLYWLIEEACGRAAAASAAGVTSPELESLQRVLSRDLPVLIHCAGGHGVASTVRLWHEELGTRCTVSHGSFNGYKVAEYVARQGVPVNHGPRTADFRSTRTGAIVGSGAVYWGAGVPNFSLNTDSPVIPQEELSLQGAMTAHLGADSYQMLRAVTIHPARSFGIDDRVGSIEAGKDADIVLWSGDPLDPRSRVELVMIDGNIEYDRANDGQWF